ncbi:Chorismate mutase I [Dissulfuribacter thermophilus]|uniref:Bifunctional chorismate mutase/prephenate dehydratase n=1 Tax=Dissulfuribacter thermophilus TaxID=1156395 RepID=A0A1B9F3J7_9BACT|nr:prephenate dehydratase [Dissulfuribacter thermophilus]OCC14508.1 Chorismate mutase I [Dissulfuribacter thermophilus]
MKDNEVKRLLELRKKIDEIDKELVSLLQKRLKVAKEIGAEKAKFSSQPLDVTREREVLKNILDINGGVFPDDGLKVIFSEIISACRNAQRPAKIGYLGPATTFTHMAACKFFGHSPEFIPQRNITEVFEEVERGRTDFGVVPLENSVEGTVALTLDGLHDFKVKVVGEVYLPISHDLMNKSGRIDQIKRILSHPHALAQCKGWLQRNLPAVPTEEVVSTAQAARWAAVDPEVAAIASPLAARTYDLQIVAKSIEDFAGNTTRFLVLGHYCPRPSGRDKTSLLLSLEDRPGSLFKLLKPLAEKGINLTKIQSRPVKDEPWRYLFYVDIAGHIEDPVVKEGVEAIKKGCTFLVWLGSYPMGLPI